MQHKNNLKHSMGWLLWGIGAFYVSFQFLLQTSTSVMINNLITAFSTDAAGVGFITSSFFYTYIILQIPAGILTDRYGARRVLTCSIALCALATIIFSQAQNIFCAEAARLLMGLATAPAVVSTLYLASHWLPARYFALAAGLTEMLGMLGGAAGQHFLARSVVNYGWRTTMIICAIIASCLAVIAWLVVRDKPSTSKTNSYKKTNLLAGVREILHTPQLWLSGIYAGFTFALIQAFASLWSIPFLMMRYAISVEKAASVSAIIFIGTAIGTPLSGIISEYCGLRRPILLSGALASLLLITIILYLPDISLIWIGLLLFFLGLSSSTYVLPFAIVKDISSPENRGTIMGFINMMCILIGAPLLQPLIGYLLQSMPDHSLVSYQIALSTLPLSLIFALLSVLFIKETHCGINSHYSAEKQVPIILQEE